MSGRSQRGRFLVAAAIVAIGVASANGAGHASPVGATSYERMRTIYDLMNTRTEELRRELNSASPDSRVVTDLKSELRALADQL